MFSCDDVFNFINNLPPPTSEYESTNRRICETIAYDVHHLFVDLSWKTAIFRIEFRILKKNLDAKKTKRTNVIRKYETQKTVIF
ncbi:Protein CBG28098 [Caenorhabditis briggsae]|uniref:Protein CBG28098 n=1 Tax=Caenorhabditis briggsae TaxID=6238 RepID=B6IGT7_CAEBR|nr:Protein CBG28098 [Caenorhabditis briggsae]CAR99117.1 Protein CBG28098 [Caenorhabditis briggsae]